MGTRGARSIQSLRPGAVTPAALALVVLVGTAHPLNAQDPPPEENRWNVSDEDVERARSAPLFASAEVLEITLAAPFDRISDEDRGDDPAERDATLTFPGPAGPVSLGIKVQTRGNWRRQSRNCDFPPIWLDLPADDPALEGTVLEGQNRLKLYVTCRKGRDEYEQYILAEYLVYPTQNLLSDLSYRARPVRVHYEDTEKPDESFTRYAFLLEHKDAMAARNRAVPLEAEQVHPALMDHDEAAFLALFNYMIGMTDWTSVYMHNVEPIRTMDGRLVPVGYDFDWSGIVNARYAVPNETLGIRNVRERVFQGFCRELDYDRIFQRFLDRKEEVLALWRGFELLDEDRRERAVRYLEEFYERAEDPGRRRRIVEDCTPIPR